MTPQTAKIQEVIESREPPMVTVRSVELGSMSLAT
jgi:hypothetical protein